MIELNNEVSSAGCPALDTNLQKLIKSERKRVDVLCSLEDIFCIVAVVSIYQRPPATISQVKSEEPG